MNNNGEVINSGSGKLEFFVNDRKHDVISKIQRNGNKISPDVGPGRQL